MGPSSVGAQKPVNCHCRACGRQMVNLGQCIAWCQNCRRSEYDFKCQQEQPDVRAYEARAR